MAVDMFLKLDGIDGESVGDGHKNEIDILAWSWGMHQNGTTHMGSGGGAGKVSINDISITKYIDQSSANLMKAACQGKHIDKGKITVRRAGGSNPLEYLKIELEEIIVSSLSTGGSHGEERLTENVTLNFRKFHVTYQKQGKDGAADGGPVEAVWDIPVNKSA